MQALAIPAFVVGSMMGGPWGGAALAAATLAGTSALSGPKVQAMPLTPTRDDAAAMLSANDNLAARKGGASDILNGDTGITQPMPGPKAVLGA